MDNNVIKWYCRVNGSRIRIKRASGFQQFIIAMGIRVELGAMIRPCRTILIDEGFTACDADHIMNSDFLRIIDRCGKFSTVLIVTHIEALQNGVSNTINMQKGVRMAFDHLKSHMGNVNSDIVPEDVLHATWEAKLDRFSIRTYL
jgi:DNA repair exonuclease SbcCD ATPase subunit